MIPNMGSMNPKQLKQMQRSMKKMGMNMQDMHGVTEVIIKMKDKELVIKNPTVNIMDFMGQQTYQVTGKAKEKAVEEKLEIPDEDIELVANQANVSKEDAEKALLECNGDLAEAITRLM